ncbi:flagellar export protein FliJ [Thiobacillus sedimenti]|uniref:Flagellar FliJ protein n=1 Tax=Thiobacillus sedimenti TaxID=3110231 RepID=A0ABZ1CLJ6_9PROT|nr:flagellar export protein FliJ [Thiobacillus sp. SCUT-2]WRS40258.1 flagellar export protein FliJ [Thiobacillus sp. SCUT-2]
MATPSALHTLIDLANKESDEAAKRLAACLRAGEEAVQKLDLLTQYRNDYAARGTADMASGISTTQLHNFQVFMQKLDYAITGQHKIVTETQQRITQARSAWQACEQKKMSFVTLAERASKEQSRSELRRDQKQTDEHAARRSLHKRPTT